MNSIFYLLVYSCLKIGTKKVLSTKPKEDFPSFVNKPICYAYRITITITILVSKELHAIY